LIIKLNIDYEKMPIKQAQFVWGTIGMGKVNEVIKVTVSGICTSYTIMKQN
jgi:hypothetical protein